MLKYYKTCDELFYQLTDTIESTAEENNNLTM